MTVPSDDIAVTESLSRLEIGVQLLDAPQPLLSEARKVVKVLEHGGDVPLLARALLALGQSAYRAASFREAVGALERVVEMGLDTIDIRMQLAHAYDATGNPGRAAAYLQECAATAKLPVAAVRFTIAASFALTDLGDLAGAHAMMEEAKRRTAGAPLDLLLRVRFSQAEARLVDAGGLHVLAFLLAREAIELIERTDDTLWAGGLHLRAGEYALFAGSIDASARHLGLAVRLLADDGSVGEKILLELNLGFLAAARGHAEEAACAARSVLARIGHEDPPTQGRALWLLGRAHALDGDLAAAAIELRHADGLSATDQRYTARIRRDLATVLDQLGERAAAAAVRAQAAAIDRVRRLPGQSDLLLREIEGRLASHRGSLDALEARLDGLEFRLAAAESPLDDRPVPARATHLQPLPD